MAEFIIANGGASGAVTSPPIITLSVSGKAGDLDITSLQDLTAAMSKDLYTWTQMDYAGKRQIPTTSAFSLSGNMVLDGDTFNGVAVDGTTIVAGSAANLGLVGLLNGSTKVTVGWNIGDQDYTASGYVTTLGPKASSDQPVWQTPVTITIDGDVSLV